MSVTGVVLCHARRVIMDFLTSGDTLLEREPAMEHIESVLEPNAQVRA